MALQPRGPLPARVYWRRRLVVLGIPALLIALGVWWLVGRGGEEDPGTSGDQAQGQGEVPAGDTTGETPPAGDGQQTPGVAACAAESLGVLLAADASSYGREQLPTFTVTVTNNGAESCLVDVGEDQRELTVTSGSDRIWSTGDCATPDQASLQLLLGPGQSDERTVQWQRVRSAEGCPADQAAAKPGTYNAQVTLAGVTAPAVVFVLQ